MRSILRHPYALIATVLLAALCAWAITNGPSLVRDQMVTPWIWQVTTGTLTLTVVLFQWVLMIARIANLNVSQIRQLGLHKWAGVAFVALLLLHVESAGFRWTAALFWQSVLVIGIGIMNRETTGFRNPLHHRIWTAFHITTAGLLMPMIALHIWIALAFK
jgi:hypothetical protein